jgi:hypothetical protein
MKLIHIIFWAITFAFHLVDAWPPEQLQPRQQGSSAPATPVQGVTRTGEPSPPYPLEEEGEDDGSDTGPPVPIGDPEGPIVPSSPPTNLTPPAGAGNYRMASLLSRQDCAQGNSVSFDGSVIFGNNTTLPSEPSGASAGNIVFATANKMAAVSFDGGFTFHPIDVTRYAEIDPALGKGFCCDQIVQYIPTIDRFVWLMQYWGNAALNNKQRLITFHPRDLTTAGPRGGAYLVIDIRSTDLGLTNILDAGDLAVGKEHLWWSANNWDTGLVVMRLPISALDVAGTFTYWYTDPSISRRAYLSRISQNPGDTVYWAGHQRLGTMMRIFRWPESGTTYFWSDLRIRDWPAGDSSVYFSGCPSNPSQSWLVNTNANRIKASTRRTTDEVWFAWTAPAGGAFPNVHTQIAIIDVSHWPTLGLINQLQIWNPNFAFAYAAFYTNRCGDVGTAVMFGGGPFEPASAVAIMSPAGVLTSTAYYPELSNGCEDRYGDYLTVRSADGVNFQGYIYDEQLDASGVLRRHSRIVGFSRSR